jgi:hypothetical protein
MSELTISCAQPDCFWTGPPADAATHDCPTPPTSSDATDEQPTEAIADDRTKAELEQWLLNNGVYDGNGRPADPATILADARWTELDELDKAAAVTPEPELDAEAAAPDAFEEPWQLLVGEELEEIDNIARMRWAVVGFDDAGPHLLGVAAVRDQANEIIAKASADNLDRFEGRIETLKVQEILAEAAELERAATGDAGPADLERGKHEQLAEAEDDAAEPIGDLADVAAAVDEAAAVPAADSAVPAAEAKQLFDASSYDKPGLQIPKIDGNAIDRIGLSFSGSIMLDRSEPGDVALYNRIHGEKERELWITAKWAGVGAKPATNRDGDLDVMVATKTLKVEQVRIVEPEELSQLQGLEAIREIARRCAGQGVAHDQIEQAVIDALAEID